MTSQVALTKSLKVEQGAHILYFYKTIETYIENVCSYIEEGIQLGQHVVIIDRTDHLELIRAHLATVDETKLHYVNNMEFYETYQDFHFERILTNFQKLINPYVDQELTVRIWGHIDWKEQDNMLRKLHTNVIVILRLQRWGIRRFVVTMVMTYQPTIY